MRMALLCIVGVFHTGVSSHSLADTGTEQSPVAVCQACHVFEEDGKSHVGPHLSGIVGRKAASVDGYTYSSALLSRGASGLVWTREALDEFLINPRKYINGLAMYYPGQPDKLARKAIIDWLENQQFNAFDQKMLLADPRLLKALELTADTEYGQYLAGECVTCHQSNASEGAVPRINGLPVAYFIAALLEYKDDVRLNPIMQTITKAMGAEELAALASYFETLDIPKQFHTR